MEISERARLANQSLWEQSFNHPFVQEIRDGSLALDKFRFYVKQDAYYVREFAKIHGLAAAQADDPKIVAALSDIAVGLAEGELQMHRRFFADLQVGGEEWAAFRPAPAAYAYIAHLYCVVCQGRLCRTMAALLPCPWLYSEIGQRLKNAAPKREIFQNWIAEYSSDALEKNVAVERKIWDKLSRGADDHEKERMLHIFYQSSYYELNFWDMSYGMDDWNRK
ncbi:thiaminase II [Sporolactobacillus sp. KGMB 08714]|uniref:thiaminase II n=1 Tax=Sporolactobacillus sp. KGMB 08714 TaxID=3064704 RepID=UPI002FBD591A